MTSDPTLIEAAPLTSAPTSSPDSACTSEPCQSAEPEACSAAAVTELPAVASEPVAPSDLTAQRRENLKRAGESVEPTLTEEEIRMAAQGVVPKSQAKGPVEIPDAPDLGAMEAEINAAMAVAVVAVDSAAAGSTKSDMPEQNARIQGTVQSIHGDDVFLDLGYRIPGVLQLRQFEGVEPPQVGAQLQVVVRKVDENQGLISVNLPRGKNKVSGNWDAVEAGQIVDCTVTKTNKGGLEVTVGSLRGFMPAGQVGMGFVENLDSYIGQKLTAKIIEANKAKRNLVLSHKQYLQDLRHESEEAFWKGLVEGQEFTGTVKTIKDYGAFIDLGGADGFLHIGQISWNHIKHPSELLKEGQTVSVKVLTLDLEKKRISLGMKQLSQNPWLAAPEKYAPQSTVKGTVTRVTDFGAFVMLEPGIEGMIHISEMDHKRIRKVTDVVNVGQEIDVKVLEVDTTKKRVGLSIKALTSAPVDETPPEPEQPVVAAQPRTRREDLRGGIGGGAGGGRFGNPSDFR